MLHDTYLQQRVSYAVLPMPALIISRFNIDDFPVLPFEHRCRRRVPLQWSVGKEYTVRGWEKCVESLAHAACIIHPFFGRG